MEGRRILCLDHLSRVAADARGGDIGDEAAQRHEEAISGEGLAGEAPCIVADEGELTNLANESGKDTLTSAGTCPDGNSSQRHNLPHGGRQLAP